MSTIKELQAKITDLSQDDFVRLRDWFEEYQSQVWDQKIELDANNGALDQLADQALGDFQKGNCTEL